MTTSPHRRAARAATVAIVHVARVRVANPVGECDLAGAGERRRRGGRDVEHLEVGVERREVHRHVTPEMLDDPPRHLVELGVGVVLAGDEQVGDLDPHVGLVDEVLERVEHVVEVRAADVVVEVLGEGLEIDVRRVHVREHLRSRLRAHVARRDGDRLDAAFVARVGDVGGVLEEDDRVVVGERDAARPELGCSAGDHVRRRGVGERVGLLRLRDVPVLAEAAGEVAAGGAERQDGRTGQEVVQRLLLDRVEAEAARPAVGGEHDLVALAGPHEAEAALSLAELAGARAHVALDPAVVELMPVGGRHGARRHH